MEGDKKDTCHNHVWAWTKQEAVFSAKIAKYSSPQVTGGCHFFTPVLSFASRTKVFKRIAVLSDSIQAEQTHASLNPSPNHLSSPSWHCYGCATFPYGVLSPFLQQTINRTRLASRLCSTWSLTRRYWQIFSSEAFVPAGLFSLHFDFPGLRYFSFSA